MFDKDLERLSQISKELESDSVSLSKGLELYEEGSQLAKSLYEEIYKTKGKITVLKQELDKFKEEGLDN